MNPLLKAGLTVSALGAALGAAAGPAQAADLRKDDLQDDVATAAQVVAHATRHATAPVKHLKINPLTGTGTDPLDNGVGAQVADFKPVDTTAVTGSLATVPDLPAAGPLLGGLLPG